MIVEESKVFSKLNAMFQKREDMCTAGSVYGEANSLDRKACSSFEVARDEIRGLRLHIRLRAPPHSIDAQRDDTIK